MTTLILILLTAGWLATGATVLLALCWAAKETIHMHNQTLKDNYGRN